MQGIMDGFLAGLADVNAHRDRSGVGDDLESYDETEEMDNHQEVEEQNLLGLNRNEGPRNLPHIRIGGDMPPIRIHEDSQSGRTVASIGLGVNRDDDRLEPMMESEGMADPDGLPARATHNRTPYARIPSHLVQEGHLGHPAINLGNLAEIGEDMQMNFDELDDDEELDVDHMDEDLSGMEEADADYDGPDEGVSGQGEFRSVEMIGPRRCLRGARNVETVKDCLLIWFPSVLLVNG
ncbi:MAG: hypothetical protein Q9228_007994 [Teloschistes exilis]